MTVLRHPSTVTFDVTNKQHRESFSYFMKNNRWNPELPRFALERPHSSIPHMITEKLLTYYVDSEFTT
jgi:hypothetical protein